MAGDNDLEIQFLPALAGGEEAREKALLGLRRELREIPGLTIERVSAGAAPEGAMAVDLETAAILLPGVVAGVELLKIVFGALRDWLSRQPPSTTIKVKIGEDEVEWSGGGAVPDAVHRLVDSAAKRHDA